MTIGIPLPEAWATGDDVILKSATGVTQLCDVRVLDRWHKGSARWVLLDFLASATPGVDHEYRLAPLGDNQPRSSALTATESPDAIMVNTGVLRASIARTGHALFTDLRTNGGFQLACEQSGFVVETESGDCAHPEIERAEVIQRGNVRVVARIHAVVGGSRRPMLRLAIELEFFVGSPTIRCSVTVHNPRRAAHPGGIWELGDKGSVLLRDLTFEIARLDGPPATIACSPEAGLPLEPFSGPFTLYQDSSGGANWRSSNHVNRHGVIPPRFRGYTLTDATQERTGLRATPVVTQQAPDAMVAVTTQHFWQNFPKALEADGRALRLRLFPRQFGDLHEVQGGEQKTHRFSVSFGAEGITATPLEWARSPLFVRCTPEWYCASGVVPSLVPADADPHQELVGYQRGAIEGPDSFEAKREVIDEYGWRNFGDIYADHEAAFHTGPTPLVSHYNNQYDAAAGMAWQFFRTGDERWWRAFLELTSHVRDIDIYHTREDKAAYNGGMFWHTYHYLDAGKCSHRSYPRAPGVAGGGPSNEHDYSGGLLLRYFLTGQTLFRYAVIGLAEWVINMDDGRQNVLGWITAARTGHASSTGDPLYHGPGRGAAYSIQTLLNAHQVTGDVRYLTKAEELLTRCIHPADDIDALNLLDAERRWFYTVFLQAVATYLRYKESRDDFDDTYEYARASLLHYAGWMAEHEYPYLDRPEILEYPTETWAAMDMRKSEVFCHAARYAAPPERDRFVERAAFFFKYSVTNLRMSSTGHLARPVVVLTINSTGYSHTKAKGIAEAPARQRFAMDFGAPSRFVPQRVIAKTRLGIGIAVAAAASAMIVSAGVWTLL